MECDFKEAKYSSAYKHLWKGFRWFLIDENFLYTIVKLKRDVLAKLYNAKTHISKT